MPPVRLAIYVDPMGVSPVLLFFSRALTGYC